MCDRFGVDPAGFLADPWLAFQLRLALHATSIPAERDGRPISEQEQLMLKQMRSLVHGG